MSNSSDAMREALKKVKLITEADEKRIEQQEKRIEIKEKRYSDEHFVDNFAVKMALGQIIHDDIASRPAEKIICGFCHAEGYSILETVTIHSALMQRWADTGEGFSWMLDSEKAKQFQNELLEEVKKKFDNIIHKDGCWKCKPIEG